VPSRHSGVTNRGGHRSTSEDPRPVEPHRLLLPVLEPADGAARAQHPDRVGGDRRRQHAVIRRPVGSERTGLPLAPEHDLHRAHRVRLARVHSEDLIGRHASPAPVAFEYSKDGTANTRPVDPEELAELARLLARPLDELSDEDLIRAVRLADADRDAAKERVGRLVAALYQRERLSWPQLGEQTGIPFGTAHGLARPYIQRDESP